MIAFYVLLPVFFAFPVLSSAQYLAANTTSASNVITTEGPTTQTQEWTREDDQVNGRIAGGKLSRMKNMTSSIVSFFHDSCISDYRYSPIWHGEYFSEKTSHGPLMKFAAVCNFYDQKSSLQVVANDISPLLDHIAVNNQDFLVIRSSSTLKNDCPYFEFSNGEADGARVTKGWLVTAGNDRLPYTVVTRKEYLTEARKELEKIKGGILTDLRQRMPVRSTAVQEREKQSAIDQLNAMYTGADLQVRMKVFLQNYRTDEEYLREHADKATADLDSTMHYMEHLLAHMSAGELNGPAVVSVQAADFRGFEDGHGGKMLIRINAGFFNVNPASERPRFFLVTWSYDPAQPDALVIDRQIQEKFDTQILRDLLK